MPYPGRDELEGVRERFLGPDLVRQLDRIPAMVAEVRQRVEAGSTVILKVGDRELVRFEPGVERGARLAAMLRERVADTFSVVEAALMPFTDIDSFGVNPEHRWREARHFRPRWAIEAVREAVDARPVTEGMVRAAGQAVPGLHPELVRAMLEAGLRAQTRGE